MHDPNRGELSLAESYVWASCSVATKIEYEQLIWFDRRFNYGKLWKGLGNDEQSLTLR